MLCQNGFLCVALLAVFVCPCRGNFTVPKLSESNMGFGVLGVFLGLLLEVSTHGPHGVPRTSWRHQGKAWNNMPLAGYYDRIRECKNVMLVSLKHEYVIKIIHFSAWWTQTALSVLLSNISQLCYNLAIYCEAKTSTPVAQFYLETTSPQTLKLDPFLCVCVSGRSCLQAAVYRNSFK